MKILSVAVAAGIIFSTFGFTAEGLNIQSPEVVYKDCPTWLSCQSCINDLTTQFPSNTFAETSLTEIKSGLDIKDLFDYTLSQYGVMTEEREQQLGECKPCIDHLAPKLTNPLFHLDEKVEVASSGPIMDNGIFEKLMEAVLALKKFHGIDMMYLYDSFMAYYSLEYSSTHDHQQGIRRLKAKRAIDFKTRC
jgi:hypothetical protein